MEYQGWWSVYCVTVGKICEQDWDVSDGADLCYHMLQSGEVTADTTPNEAARMVAQRILQP